MGHFSYKFLAQGWPGESQVAVVMQGSNQVEGDASGGSGVVVRVNTELWPWENLFIIPHQPNEGNFQITFFVATVAMVTGLEIVFLTTLPLNHLLDYLHT